MSVDPLAGKHSYRSPYQYAGNDPINQTDVNGGEGSGEGGGGGGGDGKATDGTGASDHKGRDIVNGVETWKDEKTGEIRVEIDRNTSQEVDKSPKSLKTKEAIKDHWKKDGGETNNIEPKDSIGLKQNAPSNAEKSIVENDQNQELKKKDSNEIVKNQQGKPVKISQPENDAINEALENAGEFTNRAGDVADLVTDASKIGKKDVQKDLKTKQLMRLKRPKFHLNLKKQ